MHICSKVSWLFPDSYLSLSPLCSLNQSLTISLSSAHDDDHLSKSVRQHFEKWGEITLVKVLRDTAGRPYAFVQYTNDENARKALIQGQSTTLDGRIIRCEPAKVNRTLFVIASRSNNSASEQNLRQCFEKFGEIEELAPNKTNPPMTRPSWFLKYVYRDDAIRAYAAISLQEDWNAEWAQNVQSPGDNMPVIDKFSIFVGQLDSNTITKEILISRFQKYGKIADCTLILRQPIAINSNLSPRNNDLKHQNTNSFAFIKYEDEIAASLAVEQENHTILDRRTIHVQYREIQHGKRRSFLTPRLELAPPPINYPPQMKFFDKNDSSLQSTIINPNSMYNQSSGFRSGSSHLSHDGHYSFPFDQRYNANELRIAHNIAEVIEARGRGGYDGFSRGRNAHNGLESLNHHNYHSYQHHSHHQQHQQQQHQTHHHHHNHNHQQYYHRHPYPSSLVMTPNRFRSPIRGTRTNTQSHLDTPIVPVCPVQTPNDKFVSPIIFLIGFYLVYKFLSYSLY